MPNCLPRATQPRVELRTDITVDEHVATDTGLLDADGNIIWRTPNPVGFGKDDEW